MRILTDENLNMRTVELLRNAGHDVMSVLDVAPGSDDREVLARSVSDNRILITLDKKDFGDLIYRQGLPAPPGLLLFRIPDIPPEAQPYYVTGCIAARKDWFGSFWVIGQRNIRSRPL